MTIAIALGLLLGHAQSQSQAERIDRIKNDTSNRYYWGEGRGATDREAMATALEDLSRQISAKVDFIETETGSSTNTAEEVRLIQERTITSCLNIQGYQKITYESSADQAAPYRAFLYYERSKFQEARQAELKRLRQRVLDLIDEAADQEEKMNIADALRLYNWALNLANYYGIADKGPITENRNIDLWCTDKIKQILTNIDVELDQEVDYNDSMYDKYAINSHVTYYGFPVTALDIKYDDGESNKDLRVRNGEGTLLFPDLSGMNAISMHIKYHYSGDNELTQEMKIVYDNPTVRFDEYSLRKIPFQTNGNKLVAKTNGKTQQVTKVAKESTSAVTSYAKGLAEEVDHRYLTGDQATPYVTVAQTLESALRAGDLTSVSPWLSTQAQKQLTDLFKTGKVSVVKKGEYSVEQADHYVRCGSIPISVKNGGNTRNERLVLRFDDNQKVESISLALSADAENDIFEKGSDWALDSRYALLKFMEDYQTAFALRDADYLDAIFNGNAVIITGVLKSTQNDYFIDGGRILSNADDNVIYRQYSKDAYIQHLRDLFSNPYNKYLYLVFDDARIDKAPAPSSMREVFWIELKQHYNSSIYSDTGYLTLQIGMRSEGSQIYVRTWTPHELDLRDMKQRYPIN